MDDRLSAAGRAAQHDADTIARRRADDLGACQPVRVDRHRMAYLVCPWCRYQTSTGGYHLPDMTPGEYGDLAHELGAHLVRAHRARIDDLPQRTVEVVTQTCRVHAIAHCPRCNAPGAVLAEDVDDAHGPRGSGGAGDGGR